MDGGRDEPYYRQDLALVHHRGFGFHAAACAPGILALLEPVRGGLVHEFGCGSGLLTRELLGAGHRVVASDASPAMLELARADLGPDADLRLIALPGDPLPEADAVVGIGHPISYLPDAAAIDRALLALATSLSPGGLMALDICDLEWGHARRDAPNYGDAGPDWAIVTKFSTPAPDRFVRDITSFVADADGSWRRDVERHENALVDTVRLPDLLRPLGVHAEIVPSFGSEPLPAGLRVLVGRRSP